MEKDEGKKKILVIDDEAITLKTLQLGLKAEGYEVITALDGGEALEKMKQSLPDLIICDILMPKIDGFDFLKAIKAKGHDHIPVLMLTARRGMAGTFNTMGVDGFMVKPFEHEALLSQIKFLMADKAILLSSAPDVADKLADILKKSKYEVITVKSEQELLAEGKRHRYKLILAHIALIDSEPKQFISNIHNFKNKIPRLIVYSDSSVKGTENNDTLVIEEIQVKWNRAGIKEFFDHRVTRGTLINMIND